MDLTIDELNILIDAMTAWESRDSFSQMTGALMGAMLAQDDEQREANKAKFEQDMEEKAEQQRREKETSIMIKAKLIGMKDKATAKAAADFMTK